MAGDGTKLYFYKAAQEAKALHNNQGHRDKKRTQYIQESGIRQTS